MNGLSAFLIFISVVFLIRPVEADPAHPSANTETENVRAVKALALCRSAAKEFTIRLEGQDQPKLELRTDPLLRWSNPSVGSVHGGIFIWTDQGQPMAICSIFKWFDPFEQFAFEIQSLSTDRLVGHRGTTEVWKSSRPGVTFKPVPTAIITGRTKVARLSQMREVSLYFAVEMRDRENNSKQRLRLLTQPIFRYASEERRVMDGAIFAFVQGTDPELLLLLQTSDVASESTFQFAFARMNSSEFHVTYEDKEIWSVDVIPWDIVSNNREPYNIFEIEEVTPGQK